CLQAQAGIMPLKGKCIPRVQRVVLILSIFTKSSGLRRKIFCYRLKILSLPYNFYIADLLLSHICGKM
ncbi:hypothetical protein ABHB17_08165, partial [[Eubacterium] siraeum]